MWCLAALVAAIVVMWARPAAADAVDDAMARGAAAYAEGRYEDAREAFEEAASLLGEPNAIVAYNLGTTYAQLGDLGRATYYLTVATDPRTHPTPEIAERARANLNEVRRRAELVAAAEKAQLGRQASWWALLLDAARAPWVGWAALVSGFFALVVWFVRRKIARLARGGLGPAIIVVASVLYVVLGALHGLALRADATAPRGVLLGRTVTVYERPSRHAPEAFQAVGGAEVRIEDRVSGFVRVRLPGNLVGWVPASQVGRLDDLSVSVDAGGGGRSASRTVRAGSAAP
ncbi:MAG: hypothetical protein D6705_03110 [Deltaproteobacteria bacterium]|nr:MAG: hypothetical protein D6705_03110 [Deltaproteobacteria bacterium]